MPFKSDDQRKAAFAHMKGKGGGPRGAPKPPPPGGSLFDILNGAGWTGINDKKPFKPNGPGIPGIPAGSYIGTGGAIYATPGSNWFQGQPGTNTPNFGANLGQVTSPGVGPYVPQTFAQFQPPQTLWGDLYLLSQGVDPSTGEIQAPIGTPGLLKFGAGTPWQNLAQEKFDSGIQFYPHDPVVSGATRSNPFPKIPSNYLTLAPNRNKKRPWWAK